MNNANVVTNGPSTRYNGIQLVFNRRFANGFLLQSNYAYGKGYQYNFYGFHSRYVETEQNYSNSGNSNATGNIRHSFDQLGLRAAVRPREALRPRCRPSAQPHHRQLELPGGRAHPERPHGGLRQRAAGRDRREKELQQDASSCGSSTDPANPYRTLVYVLPQDIIDNTIKALQRERDRVSAVTPDRPLLRARQRS